MNNPFRQSLIRITRLCVPGLMILGLLTPNALQAQQSTEKVDLPAINRIKEEESKHSQVMEMVAYLTDVTGPRLTGSRNLKQAESYAMDRSPTVREGNLRE